MFLFLTSLILRPPTYSLSLSHPGDGLRVPDSPILDPAGDLTVEAWIRPVTANNGGSFHFIVSKNYGGTGYSLVLIGRGDDVRLQFEARDSVAYFVKMSVLANRWWHLAGVYRAHHDLTMYLNGVEVAHKDTSLDTQPNNQPLYIGTSPWDSFCGQIADVRVWNVARTQEQILDSMNQRFGEATPGLAADWTFRTVTKRFSYDQTHHTKPAEVLGTAKHIRPSAIRS